MIRRSILLLLLLICYSACGDETTAGNPNEPELSTPEIFVVNVIATEQEETSMMTFEVKLSSVATDEVKFDYNLKGLTAEPGVDFISINGIGTIAVGENKVDIDVEILADDVKELEEEFEISISNVTNAQPNEGRAIGLIKDMDDESLSTDEDGYLTAANHYGYKSAWAEEFDGTDLDLESFNYDIGDGCPNLCGWGNNELELYTDDPANINIENGSLTITAIKEEGRYYSTKIHTKDKKEFLFGRLDIRAKLPEGQGIWPAVWLLGDNIDEIGWPACGEIDIMEMVGHEPKTTHGTAHWGPQGGQGINKGSSYKLNEKFSESYHVFSLVWEFNKLTWYVDENKFYTLRPSDIGNEAWRYNHAFYLILNVAVGGNWPGSPDSTTEFPQHMEIDYVRWFQRTNL